jgi:hypothetical protein
MALHLLLTPMLLASDPTIINLPEMIYDHAKQMSVIPGQVQEAQIRMTTWNGTQTFNFQGRPSDADND